MEILFRRTRNLERKIDEYLDLVVQGGLLYRAGVDYYLDGRSEDFEARLAELDEIESRADDLRRDIETRLYTDTLIPESRGDVLGLLEAIDKVLNVSEENLGEYSVEQPMIIPEVHELFREHAKAVVACMDSMIMAARSYFRDPKAVRDHITRARFHEKESDDLGEKMRRRIFAADIEHSRKIHQRYFAWQMGRIADSAEDVCDRLAIANIKRSL
jgi:predicted phosphate transport protein (TIGR00153 family)